MARPVAAQARVVAVAPAQRLRAETQGLVSGQPRQVAQRRVVSEVPATKLNLRSTLLAVVAAAVAAASLVAVVVAADRAATFRGPAVVVAAEAPASPLPASRT
jgi:hypothetical protein